MSTRRGQESASAALRREKNKIRGVFGTAQSRGRERPDQISIYRHGVRKVLLEAREKLGSDERTSFLNWWETLSRAGGQRARRSVAFDPMAAIISSTRMSVLQEIDWLILRIRPQSTSYVSFEIKREN